MINIDIKNLIDEDFANYKEPSLFIGFPKCSFKCEKECGQKMCQNSSLAQSPNITISTKSIVNRYLDNNITTAIVFGGLEPLDTWSYMFSLIENFRVYTNDMIVIYTGYNKEEIKDKIKLLQDNFCNIIVKFGRYIPNQEKHFDKILGVNLASDNQYAERIC